MQHFLPPLPPLPPSPSSSLKLPSCCALPSRQRSNFAIQGERRGKREGRRDSPRPGPQKPAHSTKSPRLSLKLIFSAHSCEDVNTRGGTRTRNLLLRREAPYPLGHTSTCCFHRGPSLQIPETTHALYWLTTRMPTPTTCAGSAWAKVRPPGIEPGTI